MKNRYPKREKEICDNNHYILKRTDTKNCIRPILGVLEAVDAIYRDTLVWAADTFRHMKQALLLKQQFLR